MGRAEVLSKAGEDQAGAVAAPAITAGACCVLGGRKTVDSPTIPGLYSHKALPIGECSPVELWTGREAAQYLKLNAEVLRRKTARGEVPALRMSNRWRYRKETLDEWLAQGCPKKGEQPSLFDQQATPGE